jgi:uncharacterized protein
MPNENERRAVAKTFLMGLRNRDWESLRLIMTKDIIWTLPGSSLISGTALGIDAVIARSQKIVSHGLTFSLNQILIGQARVAPSLNNTARRRALMIDALRDSHVIARRKDLCN